MNLDKVVDDELKLFCAQSDTDESLPVRITVLLPYRPQVQLEEGVAVGRRRVVGLTQLNNGEQKKNEAVLARLQQAVRANCQYPVNTVGSDTLVTKVTPTELCWLSLQPLVAAISSNRCDVRPFGSSNR